MATNDELKEHLVKIYECLQSQEGRLFDLTEKIRSLEMALLTNQSFAELLLVAERALESEERLREHAAKLAEFDILIQQLRHREPRDYQA
jgi:hypothetical protein